MHLTKGDLLNVKNITYKDIDRLDPRINGHPAFLPIDIGMHDDNIYFFMITSQVHKRALDPARYFLLQPNKQTKLGKLSMIDLKYVYKQKKNTYFSKGYVPEPIVLAILNQYNEYPDKSIDGDADEIIELLQTS